MPWQVGGPCVMEIFAHPDDETYRYGGTLALLARRGVRVQVFTATRGQAGSCSDPSLCTPDGNSGYPDHVVIGRCARRACERTGEVEGIYAPAVPRSQAERLEGAHVHTVPGEDITLAVDISPAWEAKWEAFGCHATQMSSSRITMAPEARRNVFLGVETFVQLAGRPGVLQDLLSGPGGEA